MAGFQRAVKHEAKLRLALSGPAGSGKTYTALTLATALAGGKPVAVIDTERGSASKYADLFAFDVLELEAFDPDQYTEAILAAATAGYAVVIVDSLSHAWNGKGGLLEQVERVAKLRHGGNSFKAWGDAEIKRKESGLIAALTGAKIHVIGTMRSKTEYVVEQNDRGKAAPRKVGTAPVQRDGMEYEFDVVGEMTPDNEMIVQKTRCPALAGAVVAKPGAALAATLGAWLGGAPAPAVTVAATHPAPASKAAQADAVYSTGATIQQLRKRMRDLGITTQLKADDFCELHLGKTWQAVTEEDAPKLEEWIAKREAHELELREANEPVAVEA